MSTTRFAALDAFRGFTIAAMILVNTPGSWDFIFAPFAHADWHGCTPTDLIFPFFLFIVGSALYFSLGRKAPEPSLSLYIKIVRRSALMFLIGLGLNAYPFAGSWEELRVMGVLQRIAIVYFLGSILVLHCRSMPMLVAVSVLILLVYWWLLLACGGQSPLSLEGNIVRQFDLGVLGASHLWQGKGIAFDPEGLLSSLPAIVNLIAGFEATRFLLSKSRPKDAVLPLLGAGAVLAVLGLIWGQWLPLNKSLWTSSYVLFSSGAAAMGLAVFIWIIDVKKAFWFSKPWEIYGLNPLFIYALSWVWVASYWLFTIESSSGAVNGQAWMFQQLLSLGDPYWASLLFALVHVIFFWCISLWLYRRNIIIKI